MLQPATRYSCRKQGGWQRSSHHRFTFIPWIHILRGFMIQNTIPTYSPQCLGPSAPSPIPTCAGRLSSCHGQQVPWCKALLHWWHSPRPHAETPGWIMSHQSVPAAVPIFSFLPPQACRTADPATPWTWQVEAPASPLGPPYWCLFFRGGPLLLPWSPMEQAHIVWRKKLSTKHGVHNMCYALDCYFNPKMTLYNECTIFTLQMWKQARRY